MGEKASEILFGHALRAENLAYENFQHAKKLIDHDPELLRPVLLERATTFKTQSEARLNRAAELAQAES